MKKEIDECSMLFWYPKTKDLQVPQPITKIVKVPFRHLCAMMDGKSLPNNYKLDIMLAADEIGFPIFLRTDHSSAKHYWKSTCYVETGKDLFKHLYEIVEFNLMADIMGLHCEAVVLREMLDLDWKFKAFLGDLPIAPEVRVFANNGKILCQHSYWFENAIRGHDTSHLPTRWKSMLKKLNTLSKDDRDVLLIQALVVAHELKGYWSLDFARGKDGKWYFIDAAQGNRSWHPECKENLCKKIMEEKFRKYDKKLLVKNK